MEPSDLTLFVSPFVTSCLRRSKSGRARAMSLHLSFHARDRNVSKTPYFSTLSLKDRLANEKTRRTLFPARASSGPFFLSLLIISLSRKGGTVSTHRPVLEKPGLFASPLPGTGRDSANTSRQSARGPRRAGFK